MSNSDSGLMTKVWGGHFWITFHSITFGYPTNPTEEQKKNYFQHFATYEHILPCKYCRESFSKFIREPDTELTIDIFENRDTLTKWMYDIHNKVNKKLGVNYCVSYDDVVQKYESFRAKCTPDEKGCISPKDHKAYSFKNVNTIDCPVLDYKYFVALEDYIFIRIEKNTKFLEIFSFFKKIIHKLDGDYNFIKKKRNQFWKRKNRLCRTIIIFMNENAISSIHSDGEYIGLPTYYECLLMSLGCTTICYDELNKIVNKVKLLNKI